MHFWRSYLTFQLFYGSDFGYFWLFLLKTGTWSWILVSLVEFYAQFCNFELNYGLTLGLL